TNLSQNTAEFFWQPTVATTNLISISVRDPNQFTPYFPDARQFEVDVFTNGGAATPPALILPNTVFSVTIGGTLNFTAEAYLTDGSSNPLAFSLLSANPTNNPMSIDSSSGAVTWVPTVSGAWSNAVLVTEQSTPPLSATQGFVVNVALTNNCSSIDSFLQGITNGGLVLLTNCPT